MGGVTVSKEQKVWQLAVGPTNRKQTMQASLNDVLLNLIYQETQDNQLGEQIQPSVTYRQSSARLR